MADQPIPISDISDPDVIRVRLLASGRPVHAPMSAFSAASVHGAPTKTTPVDADEFGYWDSVGLRVVKTTWANLKATLKTYFDTLYRIKLTANRTYYVRTDGSDSNTGLVNSAGGAFLTLQKAYTVIRDTIDLAGYTATIQVGDGTYTAGLAISGPLVGGDNLVITGNTGTPANCIISVTSNNCISAGYGAKITVSGFKLQTTTGGDCLLAFLGGQINYQTVDFGACAAFHVECHDAGTRVVAIGNYTISGGAQAHFHCYSLALIQAASLTVTLTGTPAFSVWFAGVAMADIAIASVTFSGAATGSRYMAHKIGLIDVNGASTTYLPGNAAGTVKSGGWYTGDEGWVAFTPTVTSGTGSITAYTATGRTLKVGQQRFFQMIITITTAGTGGGAVKATLPEALAASAIGVYSGMNINSAITLTGISTAGGSDTSIFQYNGATTIASGIVIYVSGQYETA